METVELRVHGVHGTSPGAMLGVGDGEVGQVAGDGLTGLYRVASFLLLGLSLIGIGWLYQRFVFPLDRRPELAAHPS